MANRVGQQFRGYRLIRWLREDYRYLGQIYLGEHVSLKTQAIVTVMEGSRYDQSSWYMKNYLAEIGAIASLEHPHILRILDFGEGENTPFLIKNYAPDGLLKQRLPKGEPLPLATIVSYVRQVASALQYAHNVGVTHRRITSENMLLGHNSDILLDFSIAVLSEMWDEIIDSRKLSRDEQFEIACRAPELRFNEPCPSSDQYALAVVVYEWLSGTRPFNGSPIEVATQHLHVPPPPLHEKISTLSSSVEQVVLTALAKDPKRRFPSMRTFAVALEQAYLPT